MFVQQCIEMTSYKLDFHLKKTVHQYKGFFVYANKSMKSIGTRYNYPSALNNL